MAEAAHKNVTPFKTRVENEDEGSGWPVREVEQKRILACREPFVYARSFQGGNSRGSSRRRTVGRGGGGETGRKRTRVRKGGGERRVDEWKK